MSRTHRSRGAAAVVLVALILAGCSSGPTSSATGPGGIGLRTFPWATDAVACPAFAVEHPVTGVLSGDPADPQEVVWLEGQAGTRLSVVWPAGFTVAFEPEAVLRDPQGDVVASAGETVELGQVDASTATGTFGDPYIASGLLFDGCYPYAG